MKKLYIFPLPSWILVTLTCLFFGSNGNAQISGTKNIPADYPSIAAFVTALNAQGPGSGGVTLNVPSGYTETAPAGGFVITATGTVANPITIAGAGGTNSEVVASASLVAGSLNDAIFKLVGSDYVTISGMYIHANPANTITAAGTNNMTEWGIALVYASATDGCQNVTLSSNTIVLDRTYQNTFGIYANSTHTDGAPTTSATATSATGGNHNLIIRSNSISNVNTGIVVLGPTAVADMNDVLVIGGALPANGNTITNFGTTGTFSSYANVATGTAQAVLVRNTKNFIISNNTIASSVGGLTSGTLRGIHVPSFSNQVTGNVVNAVNSNSISLQSANTTGAMTSIDVISTSANATTDLSISNNNFHTTSHTVASSGTTIYISATATALNLTVNSNTFTNLTSSSTGSVTFIAHSYTIPTGGTQTINSNSIVGTFNKTGAGGSVILTTTSASSVNGTSATYSGNNFSNITLTGATTFTGFSSSDGLSTGSSVKTITNNIIQNIGGGTNSMTGMSIGYIPGVSTLSNNTIDNFTGGAAITGITIGSSLNTATSFLINGNTISNLSSNGASGAVTGLTVSNTSSGIEIYSNSIFGLSSTTSGQVTGMTISGSAGDKKIYKNKIYNLSSNNASGTVFGISMTSALTSYIYNNIITGLTAPITSNVDGVRGLSINVSTANSTIGVYYNTVYFNASSTGTDFGSTGIFHAASATATTGSLDMRNNIIINESTPSGTGLTVAYRISTSSLANYNASSNNNMLYAGVPSSSKLVFYDGTTSYQTMGNFKVYVAPLESASTTGEGGFNYGTPGSFFTSLTGSNVDYMKPVTAIPTLVESGAAVITTPFAIPTDFAGLSRPAGTGVSPDMGAREFEGTVISDCSGTPVAGSISGPASVCAGASATLALTGASTNQGISYQWKVATTPGGPYTNLGVSNFQGTGAMTATSYYIVDVTCSFSASTSTTSEYTLVVNPTPTVTITPSRDTICVGNTSTLTASGADTYTWTPGATLSATTGSVVTATPAANTTYNVTGTTTATGCSSGASQLIVLASAPRIANVTATPSNVCAGGSTVLDVNNSGSSLINGYGFNASNGASLVAMTGATVAIANSVDDTPSGVQPIGFSFNFNNADYTDFSVSPDGWIRLGSGTATSQFTNSVISTTNTPKIYPYWDDMATGTDGNVSYLVTGTAPNRVLVVQWFVTVPRNTTGAANSTFQAWLSEATGKVSFVYGAMGPQTGGSASIGMTGNATNYQSVTIPANTVSTSTSNNSNSVVPSSGERFDFTLPINNQGYTYAWTPALNLNNPSAKSPTASNIILSSYYVVQTSKYGCSSKDSVFVTAGTPLTSDVTWTPNDTICEGGSIDLSAIPIGGGGPYTYSWTGPNGYTSSAKDITLAMATPAMSGKYKVVITDFCGATSADSAAILINPNPVVTINASQDFYCAGSPAITLTASGANTYTWSPAAGLSATTGATVNASPSAATTYVATGTFTATGCFATGSKAIATPALPVVYNVTATPATVCTNEMSNLLAGAFVPTSVVNYTFASGTSSGLMPMTGSTQLIGTGVDDTGSGVFPIGFTFGYQGAAYTDFSVTPDGFVRFGTTAAANQFTNSVTSTTNIPKLYPYWDDMATGTTGHVRYLVTGTAPNRILVVEWFVTIPRATAGAANSTFQAWMYEGTNKIEFHYGAMGPQTSGSASGGLTGSASEYQSLTFSSNTVSLSTANNSNADVPVAGQKYTFTPPTSSITYAWSPAGSLQATTGAMVTTTPLTTGTLFNVVATTAAGCSASGSVNVAVLPASSSTISPIACDSYTSPSGLVFTSTGTYMDTIPNAVGCDSVITINLTIKNSTTASVTASTCTNYTAPSGAVYSATGVYMDTIPNAIGCDSVITINLTVLASTTNTVTVFTCTDYTGPSGMVYTATGTYMDTIPNAAGCDSITTINLTVGAPTTSSISPSVCTSYTSPSGLVWTASGNYMDTIPNASGCDSIISIALTIRQATSRSISVTQCGDYTSPSGQVFTTSGTYMDTIPNAAGCDSVITITLTISTINVSIVQNGSTLTVGEAGANYNWLDCGQFNVPISGATSQSYTATMNGSYAVRVSKPGCVDTSVCTIISNVGLNELTDNAALSFMPNPTSGQVQVKAFNIETMYIEVMDAKGKLIFRLANVKNGDTIDLTAYDRGMYFIKVISDKGEHTERIIKN